MNVMILTSHYSLYVTINIYQAVDLYISNYIEIIMQYMHKHD